MGDRIKVPKRISVRMLRAMGACEEGIADFHSVFGKSAEFVPGNVYQFEAARFKLGMGWLLSNLDRGEYELALERTHAERALPRPFHAAALCRLARANLPKKKVRAAR